MAAPAQESKRHPRMRQAKLAARQALVNAGHPEFKTQGSAKWTDITTYRNGKILVQIEHDDLAGVTPEMLLWFFKNLSGYTLWNGYDFTGPEVSLYHLWHHRDHIAITPLTNAPDGTVNRGFLEGADTRIEEYFNENHSHIYQQMRTRVLNEEEFTFDIIQNGKVAGHIKHTYKPTEYGVSFYAETLVGMPGENLGEKIFNALILPRIYSQKDAENWIYHNIEETGRTQDIVPTLYANPDKIYFK